MTPFAPDAISLGSRRIEAPAKIVAISASAGTFAGFDSLFQRAMDGAGHPREDRIPSSVPAVENPTAGCHDAGADADDETGRRACDAGMGAGCGEGETRDGRAFGPNQFIVTVENKSSISGVMAVSARCDGAVSPSAAGVAAIPEEELKKLVRVLRSSAVSGRRGVSLTLSLAELGEVRFDVRLDGKEVLIQATVGDQRAAAALAVSLGELGKRLAECDLALGGFEISVRGTPRPEKRNERGVAVRVTAMTRR